MDEESNEVPAVRELLRALADLAGAVITIDALHTQGDTAQVILGRGAGYVMTVKGSMPTLYRKLKKLPWAAIPSASPVSTGHGRRARRTIKVALAPAWIEFAGAAQVAQLRRTVTKKGRKTVEVVYLITSGRDAGPAILAAWVRGHWEIEVRHEVALFERDNRIGGSNDRRLTPGECSAPVPAPGMRRWQRRGVKPGRSPRTGVPSAGHRQGKDRRGRTRVNPRKLRQPELRKVEAVPEER